MSRQGPYLSDFLNQRKSHHDFMMEKNRLLKKNEANTFAGQMSQNISTAHNSRAREDNRRSILSNYRQEQQRQINDNRDHLKNRNALDNGVYNSSAFSTANLAFSQNLGKNTNYADDLNSAFEEDRSYHPNVYEKPKPSTSGNRSSLSPKIGGAFGSLMAIEKMQKNAFEKSQELKEMVSEQIKEHEERKADLHKARNIHPNGFQGFLRSMPSNNMYHNQNAYQNSPYFNSKDIERDAQSALSKSKDTWEKIQNTKSNYDELIRIQEQYTDPDKATQAMKNIWISEKNEAARARRNMKKRF